MGDGGEGEEAVAFGGATRSDSSGVGAWQAEERVPLVKRRAASNAKFLALHLKTYR
jgi:hypothetical protein